MGRRRATWRRSTKPKGGQARPNWRPAIGPTLAAVLGLAASSAAAIGGSGQPAVQAATKLETFAPPYTFDANSLWSQLTQVTALPIKDLTRGTIETIFGVKLNHGADRNPSGPLKSYEVHGFKDWYYDLSWQETAAERWFSFEWGQVPGERPTVLRQPTGDICISQQTAHATLIGQGWTFEGTAMGVGVPDNDHYRIPGRVLMLDFDHNSQCLILMFLSGRRS